MGIDLYVCVMCKNRFNEHYGNNVNCKNLCDFWICFNCVEKNSKDFIELNDLTENCSHICDKTHDNALVKDKIIEELKVIIDNLYFRKKIGTKLHNKILDLINNI